MEVTTGPSVPQERRGRSRPARSTKGKRAQKKPRKEKQANGRRAGSPNRVHAEGSSAALADGSDCTGSTSTGALAREDPAGNLPHAKTGFTELNSLIAQDKTCAAEKAL